MPTRPFEPGHPSWELAKQAHELKGRGHTGAEVADIIGRPAPTVCRWIRDIESYESRDPVVAEVMNLEGTGLVPRNIWKRGKDEEGNRYTVHLAPERKAEDQEEFYEAIRSGLSGIKPTSPAAHGETLESLAAVYPIADLHVGLLTDEEETGVNWDTKIGSAFFREKFDRLLSVTPNAETAVIAQLGDLTHTDDQQNVTPQSKHQLDVDSRFFVILRRAVACMKYAIDSALVKHKKVIYRGCRGNHDMTAHYAVTFALSEHYANEPRVTIEDSANEFYVFEYGANMVLLCHGDKTTPQRLSMFAADEFAPIWGRTKYRRALTGHVHHQRSLEAGGMLVESIGTIIPRDAYAHSHGYSAGRALVSIVLDKDEGEISRHRVAA